MDGHAEWLDLRPGTVTFHFDAPAEALEFWERTNPPLIALKTMLPADRYRQCRDAAVDLFATGRRKGESSWSRRVCTCWPARRAVEPRPDCTSSWAMSVEPAPRSPAR
jgi:hypothetical protein